MQKQIIVLKLTMEFVLNALKDIIQDQMENAPIKNIVSILQLIQIVLNVKMDIFGIIMIKNVIQLKKILKIVELLQMEKFVLIVKKILFKYN